MASISLPDVEVSGVTQLGNKFPEKLKITCLNTPQQVEAMKEEIRDKIAIFRNQLNSLECDLIAEVERLGALHEVRFEISVLV